MDKLHLDESILNTIHEDFEVKNDLSTVLINLQDKFLGEAIYKGWYKLSTIFIIRKKIF